MAWKVLLTNAAKEDIRRTFRHLFDAHRSGFGRAPAEASDLSAARVKAIERNTARLATGPCRGTVHAVDGHEYRHVTIDRATYWFMLDEASETVRVVAIFHGGQDHLARMFARLTAKGEAD